MLRLSGVRSTSSRTALRARPTFVRSVPFLYLAMVRRCPSWASATRLTQVVGPVVDIENLPCNLGASDRLGRRRQPRSVSGPAAGWVMRRHDTIHFFDPDAGDDPRSFYHVRRQMPVGQGGFHVGGLRFLTAHPWNDLPGHRAARFTNAEILYVYDCGSEPKSTSTARSTTCSTAGRTGSSTYLCFRILTATTSAERRVYSGHRTGSASTRSSFLRRHGRADRRAREGDGIDREIRRPDRHLLRQHGL